MTRDYCTLFDYNYLAQGIALYNSLCRHADEFRLFVLCMDDKCFDVLSRMSLPSLVPIRITDVLDDELAESRARTTHGQFCWVCQPVVCRYVLDKLGSPMVTYLESDSMFFSSPEPVFAELGDRSVTLVPHSFPSKLDYTRKAGRFCVQFNAFRNDPRAKNVLRSWLDSCLEYDKQAPGRYPGQTCLNDWPSTFPGVHVVVNPGAGVAPWNLSRYSLGEQHSIPTVDGVLTIFFHFHQYGRYANGSHELGNYPMTREAIRLYFAPYVRELRKAGLQILSSCPEFSGKRLHGSPPALAYLIRHPSTESARLVYGVLRRKFLGRYNVFPDSEFL